MAKIQTRKSNDNNTAHYENFNILDVDGNWVSVNISYNADREYADENFDAIVDVLERELGVKVTQEKPSATKAKFKARK
jgi:hypothetical protein